VEERGEGTRLVNALAKKGRRKKGWVKREGKVQYKEKKKKREKNGRAGVGPFVFSSGFNR
jgi:hypothetical protein